MASLWGNQLLQIHLQLAIAVLSRLQQSSGVNDLNLPPKGARQRRDRLEDALEALEVPKAPERSSRRRSLLRVYRQGSRSYLSRKDWSDRVEVSGKPFERPLWQRFFHPRFVLPIVIKLAVDMSQFLLQHFRFIVWNTKVFWWCSSIQVQNLPETWATLGFQFGQVRGELQERGRRLLQAARRQVRDWR